MQALDNAKCIMPGDADADADFVEAHVSGMLESTLSIVFP
jgi:hypothetical protein